MSEKQEKRVFQDLADFVRSQSCEFTPTAMDNPGQNNNQNNQRGKLPLPTFSAEGTSPSAISIDAEQFLARFNDWAAVCGYDGERKAKALGHALTDAAANWHKQMGRRGKLSEDNWGNVEQAFRARFVKAVSPRYIAGELNKLAQKPTESVADFLDRCELAQTFLDEQWAIAEEATNRAARLEVTESVHQALVLHHFLRHLRPEIGDSLALCQNLETLDDHVKAAERIEKAGAEKSTGRSNVAAMGEEIAALGGGQAKKKKKVPPPSYVCRICNVKGHYINDCPRSDKQTRKRGPGQQQQAQHNLQQQPPRHLGAIPKVNHWQRPAQHHAAAMSAGAYAYHPGQAMPPSAMPPPMPPMQQQTIPWTAPTQPLYPQLPPEDPTEGLSTMSVHDDSQWPSLQPQGF